MQNKHQKKNFVVGVPTSREGGGVKPVGPKDQVCQRKNFCGSPYRDPYANQKRRRETDKVYDEQAGSMQVDPRKVDQG